jgi:ATP-binding cassette subfamily B protein/subfamily B ATP-binding cassette protein MsbA
MLGGREIVAGERSVGEFMAFFTAMVLTFQPLRRLGELAGTWQTAAASLERVYRMFDTAPSVRTPARPIRPAPGDTTIRFDDVHLSYGNVPALKGLSFVAAAGQTTALVGPSGAGKTTVFNLLARLIDPQTGRIMLGGTDLAQMDPGEVRDFFSVVTQDAALFDETIRENILLGRRDVAPDKLAEVLQAAHVSEFVDKLPRGLDTPAGPRGSALSGGQRQRVAIARALLRDAPILLMDEATSALDAQSEALVQSALERLSAGRTTLVIAHRLATVRGADRIVVMDGGVAVDEGTHDDLVAHGGLYADLCRLQFDRPTAPTGPGAPPSLADGEERGSE